jgi:AraC family transcriptional regulator of adaptative response/methylated-DNA-[protein]-cysteine methyltransferase
VDAALAAGYEGSSGFGDAVKSATGKNPSDAAESGTFMISRFETPLGTMVAGDWKGALCLLEFADRRALEKEITDLERLLRTVSRPGHTALHGETEKQLMEYFKGERKEFSLPLDSPGSEFQRSVWKVLIGIPYGQTRSYRDQAIALGRREAVRAVANANGQNRISIVIPCHRVIGADGSLTGYGGGLPRKKALLELEAGGRES